jgi:hypothetical protein
MVRFAIKSVPGETTVAVIVNGNPRNLPDGQVLAAALLADGIAAFGCSVTAGEPRGPLCLMGSCFQCAATVDGEPQTRTCRVRVRAGMTVELDPPGGAAR